MRRVAVVEDNADNRLLVQAFLEGRCAIDEYETGPEALAGMEAGVPDLVLMDISLPGMDGVGVLAEMRRRDTLKDVPVVALTAHAMAGDRDRFLSQGFQDYVAKPIVDEEQLLGVVDRWSGVRP